MPGGPSSTSAIGCGRIPAERMKVGKEHRVPLSNAALTIVERMAEIRSGEFVFPGGKAGRPLSNMAFLMLLRRLGRDDLTVHGFRSSFRDWAAERTGFPAEVAEMALAHAVSDKVEAAYRRGEAWAKFCAAAPRQEYRSACCIVCEQCDRRIVMVRGEPLEPRATTTNAGGRAVRG